MKRETGTEYEILDRAIHAVERETGLRLHLEQWEIQVGNRIVDAFVRLEQGDRVLAAEIKKWAQHANLGALINQVKQLPEEGVLGSRLRQSPNGGQAAPTGGAVYRL